MDSLTQLRTHPFTNVVAYTTRIAEMPTKKSTPAAVATKTWKTTLNAHDANTNTETELGIQNLWNDKTCQAPLPRDNSVRIAVASYLTTSI